MCCKWFIRAQCLSGWKYEELLTLQCLPTLIKLIFRLVSYPQYHFCFYLLYPLLLYSTVTEHQMYSWILTLIETFIESCHQSKYCPSTKTDVSVYCYNWFVQILPVQEISSTNISLPSPSPPPKGATTYKTFLLYALFAHRESISNSSLIWLG